MATFKDVNEYLDTVHHIDKTLVGDPTKVVTKSEYGFTMREIICNLLAGRGLKIPNIQVCVSVNIKAILGHPNLPEDLKIALDNLDAQFDAYMAHTSIDNIIGRINKTVDEISQVANMLNFCATAIEPLEIPNVLENLMDSYLGAGKDLIDSVGTMLEPGGCLGFDGQTFNTTIFNAGILKEVSDKWTRITDGSITQNEISALVTRVENIVAQFETQMNAENGTKAILSSGGSQFDDDSTSNNNGLGVMFDANSAGVQGAAQIAGQLQSAYDQLAGYPVKDKDGKIYKNIFETFLEPGIIALLEQGNVPVATVADQQEVYDYCGNVIGYVTNTIQGDSQQSTGTTPTPPTDSPGYNGGGLVNSDPFNGGGGGSGGTGGGSTTITNITQTGSSIEVVSSESAMISLSVPIDTIVVRLDEDASYVRVASSGTINDWEPMSTPLSLFLRELNDESGDGVVIKSGNNALVRSVQGTANETTVSNSTGAAGNIIIGISDNAVMPGSASITLPNGTTAQRGSGTIGKIRYNTTTNRLETYIGGTTNAWRPVSTGEAVVSDAENIGAGTGLFAANTAGTLTFKTLVGGDGISLSSDGDSVTITNSATSANVGSGDAGVFKNTVSATSNFRSLTGTNNITITENTDTITIAGDEFTKYGTTATSDATQTELLVDGARIAPPLDTAWFVSITVIGRRTNGSGKMAMKREGIVDNSSGTVSLINDDSNSVVYANDVGNAWSFDLDDSGNVFKMLVTGAVSTNIQWTARIHIVAA